VVLRSPDELKYDDLCGLENAEATVKHWEITPEQDCFARAMGDEMLEVLRAAGSNGGLQLGTLSWIVANLEQHGFIDIGPAMGRRLRATVTPAGRRVLAMRPPMDEDRGAEDH
jgi:hypothetical protein